MLSVISMKLDRKKVSTKALAAVGAVIVLLLATWLTRQWWIFDKIGGSSLGTRLLGHCSGDARSPELAHVSIGKGMAQLPQACRYSYP